MPNVREIPIFSFHFLRAIFACTLLFLLSACTTLTAPLTHDEQQVRPYQEHLQLAGRMSVQYQRDDKPQSVSGGFEWRQDGENLQIRLLSPLGQTIADIAVTPTGASLQQANQPVRYANNIDQLITNELGWPLPVLDMRDWLQGFIRDQQGQRQMLAAKETQLNTANGWTLHYVNWQENDQQSFPKRIDLSHYNPQLGQIQVRVILNEWTNL